MELIVSVIIIGILALISLRVISSVMQKAKVVSAKAQIAQLALLLESVRDDTGLYPVFLQHLTLTPAPTMMGKRMEWLLCGKGAA